MTFLEDKILFQERFMLYCEQFTNIHMNKPRPKRNGDTDDEFGSQQIEETVQFLEDLEAEDDPYLKAVLEDARKDYIRSMHKPHNTNGDR